mmetsp:Transcript_31428/g.90736  ORF Transcript_31428/g.90736 Transcript_31428/m.90736 type:complete len:340 (-) Transcript_31428:149-1168(-)|eukprot:CAMPEP_0177209324 /NCGR_PEP_ID=MMETSP0367-20130122/30959_1 /TAXON_ID=447022 ORGANISM="Scrippsiella hangoei-like, Strain SHHI-4" /NCGR_SAMPLE_ID=MMETSP0367 /ASSEMBLY_ACC=CAM_ASM_000362 /LENGTH=339 /DNA_ID=CAMNT_0018658357 /DNA_START=88 /DNA_END=1107 /DNA_ORIENTATION=-
MNPSAAVAGAALVDPDAAVDHKTALNQFCQRYCKRPVTKQDIVYVVNRFGNQYQSIVKLNCFSGQEYAGHLSMSSKEAEKSAAQQALLAYAASLEALGPKEDVPKKKKPSASKLSPAEAAAKKESQAAGEEEEDNPAITAKTKLNSLCMKIAKRYLQKGETVYESLKVTGGYQATVKLGALPGEWAQRCWAGEVCSTKQKAEQSAAEIALSQVLGDSTLSEEAAKPKDRVPKAGKRREGMGKWVWQGSEEHEEEEEEIPRARVGEGKITCTVVEWKGAYGWVRPAEALDHPAAFFRGGKIYVHKSDLEGGLAELEAGTQVEMFVYEDPSGLGGEEVTAV